MLDLAAEARDELTAIGVISDAVRSRRTTPARLLETLTSRTRIARRPFLESVLADVAGGSCSALEHAYLTRVERAHGLPVADRQVRESPRGVVYRDVDYRAFGPIVELDGRLFHSSTAQRDADLDRDLDAALEHRDTVRLGWGPCLAHSCATAQKMTALLRQRGWRGSLRRCPQCHQRDGGDPESAGDSSAPLSA